MQHWGTFEEIFGLGKAISIEYYENLSVVVSSLSVKQNASFVCRIVLSFVACPTHITSWRTHFGENVIANKIIFFTIFFTIFFSNISQSKNNSAKYYHKLTYVFI
jgi:hypothetical protein